MRDNDFDVKTCTLSVFILYILLFAYKKQNMIIFYIVVLIKFYTCLSSKFAMFKCVIELD